MKQVFWICDSEYGRTIWLTFQEAWQEHCYFNDCGEHSSVYCEAMNPVKWVNLQERNGY